MRILFFGTPEFAVPALQTLIDSEHEIVGVFTREPKPQGRGLQLTPSPVDMLARKANLTVHTPKNLKNPSTVELIKLLTPEVIVVVAYGLIVPTTILNIPTYGCLNIHPSKLPLYRGAAPLQRTIMEGQPETAICIMQMDAGLDTGDILLQQNLPLPANITLQHLHDKCAIIGSKLLLEVLENIEELTPIPQATFGVSYAHKITKEEGRIDWSKTSRNIDCQIRGTQPWPGSYFYYQDKMVKVLQATYTEQIHAYQPGQIMNHQGEVACQGGTILLQQLKPAGKPAMSAESWLNGLNILNNQAIILK